jgi:predicted nucleotidyltransferase
MNVVEASMKTPTLSIPAVAVSAFCRKWRVAEMSLFGSAVREDFQVDSDVDVLVRFEVGAPWNLLEFTTMRDELAAIFEREVDLIEEAAVTNPFRRTAILRDKRVIYAA